MYLSAGAPGKRHTLGDEDRCPVWFTASFVKCERRSYGVTTEFRTGSTAPALLRQLWEPGAIPNAMVLRRSRRPALSADRLGLRPTAITSISPAGLWYGVLVDVLFLSVVDAHKRLDRFDHALSVTDQVAICIGGN